MLINQLCLPTPFNELLDYQINHGVWLLRRIIRLLCTEPNILLLGHHLVFTTANTCYTCPCSSCQRETCLNPEATDVLEGAAMHSLPNTSFSSFLVSFHDKVSTLLETGVFLHIFGHLKPKTWVLCLQIFKISYQSFMILDTEWDSWSTDVWAEAKLSLLVLLCKELLFKLCPC